MRRTWRSAALAVLVVASALTGAVTAVSADQPDVQLSSVTVSPDDPTTGESVTVETTISNLASTNGTVDVTAVYLRKSGRSTEYGRTTDVGSIAPGSTLTVPLTASFDSAGEQRLTVHVTVRDADGEHTSYEYPVSVDVEDPVVKAGLSTTTNDSGRTTATLTNYGNVNFTDVAIETLADGDVLDSQYTFDVDPAESRSVAFDTEGYDADTVTFRASYTANGETHETTRTVALEHEVTGRIRLTGVEATQSGSTVTLDGDAANVGGTDVDSLLVSVQDSGSVAPSGGAGEYFVGSVDASEFATFELDASVSGDVTSIPVELTYLVGGERVTTTQSISVASTGGASTNQSAGASGAPSGMSGPPASSGSGGIVATLTSGPALVGLVAVLVALGGGLYYLWNRE
ncbi:hypothetical protein EFA46_009900 [Halarchaeum sp. CBA1220]|uniref:CARDB domain-containing protein n=1 Tax=Halarchaeum sp. CBA1220 TaxID=1853682 RepID=UPI0011CDDC6D|nr:CARDB domain-containing protein [Halarchaeum sp. CBA1220]QLC34504.1 hypothetical protein EFA46_009900 [Halarchaeum sp. CBA1220]